MFLHFACIIILNGQQIQSTSKDEEVVLFSDRNLYIAGEHILFSAYLKADVKANQTEKTAVLYCELIGSDGNKIAGCKYLIKNSSAFGYLTIPSDITTGIIPDLK